MPLTIHWKMPPKIPQVFEMIVHPVHKFCDRQGSAGGLVGIDLDRLVVLLDGVVPLPGLAEAV